MAGWNPRAKEVFLNALEIKVPEKRRAYLESTCAQDEGLQEAVEALLQAHGEAGSFLARSAGTAGGAATGLLRPEDAAARTADFSGLEKTGSLVAGRYKLLQQLGEGGMGTVWMAEQSEPVKRLVALKVIKAGMDSAQVISRFEAERQALALMDHPNIAKVLDAGATASGKPYFVMELVKGISITKYCDERRLSPRDRLALFIPVCHAVQHAHQKGIIHRDLKPSNVMIALYDGKPVPKVIDFGVAKAAGQKLTEKTLYTGFGAIVGTLEYMSPEQAELNQLDIDTRSDIYSLGVLLYELLTGSTPLSRERLKGSALLETLRLIREEEPPKPSARLSSSEALPTLSAQRQTEPGKLSKLMRGELDWIVMKALEKDRERRYENATGLAQDIERYLMDEPVQAGPPSPTYRLRKFVKRNKGPVLAALMLLLTLVAGILGTTWGLLEAQRRRDDAEEARQEEAHQRLTAVQERKRAEQGEEQVQKRLAEMQQTLFTAQVYRAAGLWQRDPVQAAKLLRDEKVCPPQSRDFAWHFYQRLCRTETALFANPARQHCLTFSPDGKLLAAGCANDGTVLLWDFAAKVLLHRLKGHQGHVYAVIFSKDGKTLISGGEDGQVLRWDVDKGKQIGEPLAISTSVFGLALHPDGVWLAIAGGQYDPKAVNTDWIFIQGEVVLCNLDTGARKELQRDDKAAFLSIAVSPDGKLVAACTSHTGTIRLWETATAKAYATFSRSGGWVHHMAFSHDGKLLAATRADFTANLWDVAGKKQLPPFEGHLGQVGSVAFSPNDKLLATSSGDNTVRLWDVENARELMVFAGYVGPITFTPDGRGLIAEKAGNLMDLTCFQVRPTFVARLSTENGPNLVQLTLPDRLEYLTLKHHTDGIRALAFSHNGKHLASVSKDKSARLCDAQTGASISMGSFADPAGCVVFSPDDQAVFMGATLLTKDKTKIGQIARYDVKNDKRLEPWLGHTGAVTTLAVASRHQLLASASADVLKLWDLATGKQIAELKTDERGPVRSLAFHPADKLLAGYLGSNLVILWDLSDGTWKECKTIPTQTVSSLAFTPAGNSLVIQAGPDISFFDMKLAKIVHSFSTPADRGAVLAFAITPDEKTVALGRGARTIELWDIASKQLRATLTGHVREISALAFSPDGKMLASGDHNQVNLHWVRGGTIKLWNAESSAK